MSYRVALIGNQNSGKSTLFNQLTGNNQRVGNFPGLTIDKKEGITKLSPDVTLIDLPGIYSLSPYSPEEMVSRELLLQSTPDAIINIVDATNLERNLYLTLQLLELNIPMVIALNHMDEIQGNEIKIDVPSLSTLLGVPLIPISATKGDGLKELLTQTVTAAATHTTIPPQAWNNLNYLTLRSKVATIVSRYQNSSTLPLEFLVTKVVENDTPTLQLLQLSKTDQDQLTDCIASFETILGMDIESGMAELRYQQIEGYCKQVLVRPEITKGQKKSNAIDSILTHRIVGIPLFFAILLSVFWASFGPIGTFFSDQFALILDYITQGVASLLISLDVSLPIQSLIVEGIFVGVGSVLSFLPILIILFFLLSILEDSGYMARVAYMMDQLLRKIGLSGSAFVPMLIGLGCSVPAILATRTQTSVRDRRLTMLLIPFISCNAKLPIYAVFTAAFFPGHGALVMMGLYLLGILLGILSTLLLSKTILKGEAAPLVLELPPYRLPTLKNTGMLVKERSRDFITRAFSVIFLGTILIWVLSHFTPSLLYTTQSNESLLATVGQWLTPLFLPLGIYDWRAVTALITGVLAKESIISTLAVLLEVGELDAVIPLLPTLFSPLAAISFLVFALLYLPCLATIAALKRELHNPRLAGFAIVYQSVFAWVTAAIIYNVATWIGGILS